MGATASLPLTSVAVEPGGTAEMVLRIRNSSARVDEFTFTVAGEAAAWTTVAPDRVSLFPDADEDVRVVFSPPRSPEVRAGPLPFAVRVDSREFPDDPVAEEGVLQVGRFAGVTGELVPRTSEGRRHGRHTVRVTNTGNATTQVRLLVGDPDAKLRLRAERSAVAVEPGEVVPIVLRASAPSRFPYGPTRAFPFFVTLEPDAGEPVVVDGALAQRAIIPRWLLRGALYATAACLALLLAWHQVIHPTVREAAQSAVTQQAAAVDDAARSVQEALSDLEATAPEDPAGAGADAGTDPGGAGGDPAGQPPQDPATGDAAAPDVVTAAGSDAAAATDFRLTTTAAPGQAQSASFVVPAGQFLSLTDLVLQNPNGDRGVMQIKRGEAAVLLETQMETFRDIDYHFVAGIPYRAGEAVVLTIICANDPPRACSGAAYFAGFLRPEASGG